MLERISPEHKVRDPRTPGATFAPGDIGWIDFETRGRVPISAGTDRYSRHAQAILLAWAIGDDPVSIEPVADFSLSLRWSDIPERLRAFYDRAERGEAVFCAHNAGFDRAVWNNATDGFPYLAPDMIIDTAVQATASGLPAALGFAVKQAGGTILKDTEGRKLIELFTLPIARATPQSHPEEWLAFVGYAMRDVEAMRELFNHTHQLPFAEWEEYWASEAINDYGVTIDLDMVKAAAAMAAHDQVRTAEELTRLTGGVVTTVNQVDRLSVWLMAMLPADGRKLLIKRLEESDDDGNVLKPEKRSLTRDRVVQLIAYLQSQEPLPEPLRVALRVLQIRLYGGSRTPAKFARMMTSHVDGVIRNQYVFNGASQTGRYSARGIQVHNLARDPLTYETDAIDALVAGIRPDDFARLGDDAPISRKLSLLIRPAIVAPPGKVLVWSDWANIEARITPWLADDDDARKRLDIFREVDANPKLPDIYTRTAAALSKVPVEEVDKKMRQRGKVTDLACGFGGGVNALLSMAASFGMHLSDSEARQAVNDWRTANPWAQTFWKALWKAAEDAIAVPNEEHIVGRVRYAFGRTILGGSLCCELPSRRVLIYRKARWETVPVINEKTGQVVDNRRELMFRRGMGKLKLWPGLLCENITQAVAADLLRGTLVRLNEPEFDWMPVVLHTHDEIVIECAEKDAAIAAKTLVAEMERGFDWTNGLPIKADATIARWYSKSPGSWGL